MEFALVTLVLGLVFFLPGESGESLAVELLQVLVDRVFLFSAWLGYL